MTHTHEWEPVIGLEIHVELNTVSKLFSAAPNRFGDEPNTNITEVCTGQPGALPVLNKEAVKKAVQFGCAISGEVAKLSQFDRKSYFYPDSPRNFQITQYAFPIVKGGQVIAIVDGVETIFQLNRVHLEDDAGMLKHFPSFAGVDYNRAGVPLIEIVSEPCIHSSKQAVAYAKAIKAILEYIDASDCNMEEGSLRFDVNVSVRKKGETTLRNKIEIKNLNSFNFMEMAIESEIGRQIGEYRRHHDLFPEKVIHPATYRWDPEKKATILMRRKEEAEDYRYFPEPDLPPVILTEEYITKLRDALPELPLARERRYVSTLGLSPDIAALLTDDKPTADYFEEALKKTSNAKALGNWIIVEFGGRFKEAGQSLCRSGIPADHVGQLVKLIDDKTITGRIAKSIADLMVATPSKTPEQIIEENPDFKPIHDESELAALVDRVLRENPQSIEDIRAGRDKALGFLVGQVMKLSRGKASPQIVNDLIKAHLNSL